MWSTLSSSYDRTKCQLFAVQKKFHVTFVPSWNLMSRKNITNSSALELLFSTGSKGLEQMTSSTGTSLVENWILNKTITCTRLIYIYIYIWCIIRQYTYINATVRVMVHPVFAFQITISKINNIILFF
jgi:hypothetical protein